MGAIKTVALIGANGNLGSVILQALVSSGLFTVTVVKRASSKSGLPRELSQDIGKVRVVEVDDELSGPSLEAALQGQDAVVVSFPLGDGTKHLRIADAAAKVGSVKRVIASDYGSCDSSSPRAQELVPLFKLKTDVRQRLQEHADATAATAASSASSSSGSSFSWTSIVCGHFFDWGLRENFLHFNLAERTADILGDGTQRSSTATLPRVAEAVVRILGPKEAETRNKVLFIQSFCVSQLDVYASLQRAAAALPPASSSSSAGDDKKKWTAKYFDTEEFIAEHKAKVDAGSRAAIEDLVFALGVIDGNWETREGFAMDLLGLENEDLDTVVQAVVSEVAAAAAAAAKSS